jgi:hypothetical protein
MTFDIRAFIPPKALLCCPNSERVAYACLRAESVGKNDNGEKKLTVGHRLSFDVNYRFDLARRVMNPLLKICMHCSTNSVLILIKHTRVYILDIIPYPTQQVSLVQSGLYIRLYHDSGSVNKNSPTRIKHTFVRLSSRA